ncbi:MAG: hypothetical protein JNK77_08060 [Saprospiraceae bacterium]|nr:hypothetical protein [Saprospiraceae bacterium]
MNNNKFRIGIAMAGAVSAGAYTAGVIDYLLEALERWEQAKKKNRELGPSHKDYDHSVPMHDVVIDVLGGASAGGMTAAITSLAMFEGMNPVRQPADGQTGNRLYDSWVNLNDGSGPRPEMVTFSQMLLNDDITDGNIPSLLNSVPVDAIAEKAKNIQVNKQPGDPSWPNYISKDLEVILTICTLRGVPIEINFGSAESDEFNKETDPVPAFKMYLHKGIAHFTINPNNHAEHLFHLDPNLEASRNQLMECAKATGAFPVGLRSRYMSTPRSYIKAHLKRMFGENININWEAIPENFDFTAVDGGTINNEPFGEVLRVLEERNEADLAGEETTAERGLEYFPFKNYAILMIDPFPSFEENIDEAMKKELSSVVDVVPQLLGALRRQAMLKESELSKGFTKEHTRAMIFPVRRKKVTEDGVEKEVKEKYAIACGSLGGFGGFFSKKFRVHDFFLGRKNCQSFLRKHFTISAKDAFVMAGDQILSVECPIFEGWAKNSPVYRRFAYTKGGMDFLPIIPDLRIANANSHKDEENGTLPDPEFEKITYAELRTLRGPIQSRIRKVLFSLVKYLVFPSDHPAVSKEEKRFNRRVRQLVHWRLNNGISLRLVLWALLIFVALFFVILIPITIVVLICLYFIIASTLAGRIFQIVVADFKRRGLI